jgi:hypothetical protein
MSGRAAWTVVGATVIFAATGIALTAAGDATGENGVVVMCTVSALAVAFTVVGALIAPREPANPIGRLFCAVGAFASVSVLLNGCAEVAGPTSGITKLGAWAGLWSPYAALFPVAIFVPLLFPDGRLLSARWRPVAWCGAAGTVLSVAGTATAPGPMGGDYDQIDNPLGIAYGASRALQLAGFLLAAAAFLAAIASLVVRYRGADELRRQQIKLLAIAAAVTACTTVVGIIARSHGALIVRDLLSIVGAFAFPVAIGVAMLRYRLYEVDRLISRSLTYAAVTAVLATTYAGLVLAGQALFSSFAGGSNLAIAVSTLVVAALFLPVRRGVQRLVDRRFNRRRYDASRTLDAFSVRLRQQLELDGMTRDLQSVVRETMQPAHVSVWLRRP